MTVKLACYKVAYLLENVISGSLYFAIFIYLQFHFLML